MKGTVKWYDFEKGYGFLNGENGNEVFVHYSAIHGDKFLRLEEGDIVEFEITNGRFGDMASNVQKLNRQ